MGDEQAPNQFFDRLLRQFHSAQWIVSDPVQYVHRYSLAADQEIAGFIAASFAYGSVKLVHRAVDAILKPMGQSPSKFVKSYKGQKAWPGFYHRFHTEEHVEILVSILSKGLHEYGSLEKLFAQNVSSSEGLLCENVLDGAARWFWNASQEEINRRKAPQLSRSMRFLFNSPRGGSACKRMVMFLRWMVRKDEIDLGLWNWLSPADLIIPVDTHVARISYYLRLRKGKENGAANWKMAKEITHSLRKFDDRDPVRYDFALARLGILDICKRKYVKSVCERCPVEPVCRYSNLKDV